MSRLLAAIVAALLFSSSIQALELYPSNTALGTVTSGVWNGGIIIGTYGGTGVNNSTNTLTLNSSTTITTAAATVLDDTSVSAMVNTLGGATATGTGGIARATSPVFTSPTLGAASATSLANQTFTTASGSMTFTPASGSSLNLALATTGDFAVNTNQLYVDTSAAAVGIGTTTPGAALHIGGTGTIRINGATSGTGTAAIIDANGDVRPLTSSIKFKQNVVGLKFDTDLIGLLRPVEYDYKESGEHDFGLIAEEVADIYPLMVNYDNLKSPYSVKYQQLSVLLLKKIQEIELRLQELEAAGI